MSGELHAPATYTPEEIALCTYWVGSSVDPRDSLDAVDNGEICRLYVKSNRDSSVIQPLAKFLYQIKYVSF